MLKSFQKNIKSFQKVVDKHSHLLQVQKIREWAMMRYNSLRDVRYFNGDLTQEEMAKRIGISKAAYCNIERGVRFGSVATWEKIQTLFNLTDDEVWKLIKKKNK